VRTVALHNLGCSKNQIDGERMLAGLVKAGFSFTDDFSQAQVIVVNTCAFIREAQQEAIDAIIEMAQFKKHGQCSTLIVAGCFSERFRNEARTRLPEVDAWAGVHDWPAYLHALFKTAPSPSFRRVLFPPVATQFLKIAEGCSRRCSFCAIPAIRGPFKSRSGAEIVREAQWLYFQGVRECVLVSQDTSSYGKDRHGSLVRLLELLCAKTKFPWIRLMYLHPQCVGDDFLRLVACEQRILPYFDIPLQHISDAILTSMGRRPLSAGIRRMIERIRTIVPGAAIRTTFIAGYPGETARHFDELLAFVEAARFERMGVFPFSPEKGTKAVSLAPRPKNATVASRCSALMEIQREISAQICASRVGKTIDVMVDGPAQNSGIFPHLHHDSALEARTMWDAPEVDGSVIIPGGSAAAGSIVPVTVIAAGDYDLAAIPVTR
jgi:ribosomal protein S12 methylthiotransferase